MYIKSTVSLLLLASLASAYPGDIDCRLDEVLSIIKQLGPEAPPFCSSYLGIGTTTITAATVTPTVTVIVTSTIRAPAKRAVAAPCPMNVFGSLCLGGAVTERGVPPSLPGPLVPFADSLISAACSLLRITTAATTVTATAPATTTTTTITTTVPRGICDPDAGYSAGGNGNGNNLQRTTATSSLDCCQKCQATQNCVANVYISNECQILTNTVPLSGTQTTPMCPLGMEDYNFGPFVDGGMVFRGPCGY